MLFFYNLYTLIYFLKWYVQVLHFTICHKLWCITQKSLKNIMKCFSSEDILFIGGWGVPESNSWLFVTILSYSCYIWGFFQIPLPLVRVRIITEPKQCYILPWFWACGRSSKSEFICIYLWFSYQDLGSL